MEVLIFMAPDSKILFLACVTVLLDVYRAESRPRGPILLAYSSLQYVGTNPRYLEYFFHF